MLFVPIIDIQYFCLELTLDMIAIGALEASLAILEASLMLPWCLGGFLGDLGSFLGKLPWCFGGFLGDFGSFLGGFLGALVASSFPWLLPWRP